MPSQEDYFDQFLEENKDEPEDTMSLDEIEKILAENNSETGGLNPEADYLDENADLMKLLENASEEDGDLQDIRTMLQKTDNNETIDEDLMALLQAGANVDEAASLQAEMEGNDSDNPEPQALSVKEQKAMEKKRLKEERVAAKRAGREAKKAEREAKKAEKEAKRAEKKAKRAAKTTANELSVSNKQETEELSVSDVLTEDGIPVSDVLTEDGIPVLDVQVEDGISGAGAPSETDMQEIDELLSLAGISAPVEEAAAGSDDSADATDMLTVDESETGDLSSEKEKKGFFARIIDFLTETDEEEDEVRGTEDIPLSDENKNILEEIDREEKDSGRKKAKRFKKNKKGKKAEDAAALGGEEEVAEAKGKKAKKAKKPKKEKKKPNKALSAEDTKSKISKRAMLLVGAVCLSVLVLIMLLVNLGGDFASKREAKKAYYKEDYETCYQVLYGKKLNESEQVMFAKSESILRINLRMKEYRIFAEEGSQVEALDVLIQTVYDYRELYEFASKWNAGEEVSAVYAQMLGILQDKYNLTESDALEIASEPDDVEYTRLVSAVAGGEKYISSGEETDKPGKTENLPDMLPEEKNFPENNGGR